jgi:hypothetical protein
MSEVVTGEGRGLIHERHKPHEKRRGFNEKAESGTTTNLTNSTNLKKRNQAKREPRKSRKDTE